MTPGPTAVHVAAGLVRRWADWYTRGVDGEAAERRRAEIASDLWEQQAQALRDGTSSWRLALSVTRRVIVGMAADLSWAHTERSASGSAIPVRGAARLVSGWSRIASAGGNRVVDFGLVVHDGWMAHLHDIVVDCRHPASVARFWAAVLDGYRVAAYDEAELARLRAKGINDPEDDPMVLVERVDGGRPRLLFQGVPEPKVAKNRVHIDVRADDPAAELQRLIGLGARVLAEHDGCTVLADLEDNEFCLTV